jgi:hypothetical protein
MFKKIFFDKFRVEKALLARKHHITSPRPSILHFSFNKAATQTVKKLLIDCGRVNGLTPALLHDYAFHHSMPFLDHLNAEEMQNYAHVFKPEGYLYTVFGGMILGIPSLERFKVVLVVRDPRDILVSDYYSIAYSHAIPDGEKRDIYLSRRQAALESTLDEYVLNNANKLKAIFEKYEFHLFSVCSQVHVARYEDMVVDFASWVDALLLAAGLEIPVSMRDELIRNHEERRPRGENVHNHLRRGIPSEHKEKLKSQTIQELNHTFEAPLNRFKYL